MALSILNNIPSLAAQNNLSITGSICKKHYSGCRQGHASTPVRMTPLAWLLPMDCMPTSPPSHNLRGTRMTESASYKWRMAHWHRSLTLLNRAVTLATESATGTVSQSQRGALDAEFSAIKAEIDRIGGKTTFNGTAVFQSSTQANLNEQDSPASGSALGSALTVGGTTTITSGSASFTFTAATGTGVNPNVVISAGAALTNASVLVASGTFTVTRNGNTTTFATGAGNTATVGDLITAINAGATTVGTGGAGTGTITVAGTDVHTGLSATLVGGQLQITDTTGANALSAAGGASGRQRWYHWLRQPHCQFHGSGPYQRDQRRRHGRRKSGPERRCAADHRSSCPR